MTDAQPQSQELGLLATLALICLIVLAAAGVIWYGVRPYNVSGDN